MTTTLEQEHETERTLRAAMIDWTEGRAYLDGAGNYRLMRERWLGKWSGRGPVAWWNRTVKREFPKPDDFHANARIAYRLGWLDEEDAA